MEVTSIQNGIIIDHVPAGTALKVLEYLEDRSVQNAAGAHHERRQPLYGTKDIIKIEDEENVDLDVLGLVARQATVGIVRGGKIVRKLKPTLRTRGEHHHLRESPLRDHHRAWHRPDVPSRALAASRSTAATTATRKPSSDLTPVVSRFRTSSPGDRNRGPAGATVFIRANPTRRCIC